MKKRILKKKKNSNLKKNKIKINKNINKIDSKELF